MPNTKTYYEYIRVSILVARFVRPQTDEREILLISRLFVGPFFYYHLQQITKIIFPLSTSTIRRKFSFIGKQSWHITKGASKKHALFHEIKHVTRTICKSKIKQGECPKCKHVFCERNYEYMRFQAFCRLRATPQPLPGRRRHRKFI